MTARIKDRQAGFTLIEVTIAIFVLAGALVIILGLQSSIVRRAVTDKEEQVALLAARRILAAIETSGDPVPVGETSGTALEVLQSAIGSQNIASDEDDTLKNLEATLAVSYRGIPTLNDQAMKQIDLKISWSKGGGDSVSISYFIPNDELDQSDPEP